MGTTTVRIQLAGEDDAARWDGFVDARGPRPGMSRFGWKPVLERAYGLECPFFTAVDAEGRIRGILPTYVVGGRLRPRRLYSLRFGLTADSSDVERRLLNHVTVFCEDRGIAAGRVTSGYEPIEAPGREIVKKTLVMPLESTPDETWDALRDKTRNLVRKARDRGLVAVRGFEHLESFYRVYCDNMLGIGVPVHARGFFESISECLGSNTELVVAMKGDTVVAGALVVFGSGAAIYPYAASSLEHREDAPNQLVLWHVMQACIERGIELLDMGEATEGGSTFRFKKNFGGQPRDIFYYRIGSDESAVSDPRGKGRGNSEQRGRSGRLSIRDLLSRAPRPLARPLAVWARRTGRVV